MTVSILDLEVFNGIDDGILRSFEHFSSDDDLIQNTVHLVKVKHYVQLAHIAKVLIEILYEHVDELYGLGGTSRWRSSLSLISMQSAK